MFVPLILFGVIFYLLYLYFTWHNDQWKKLGLPHVPPMPFLGNSPNGILQRKHSYYDIQEVVHKFRGHYSICGFYNFRKPHVLLLDSSTARIVFQTEFNKFSVNDFASVINKEIDPILGYNPFMLNGDEWKEKRAEATPAFTASRLRAMYPLIVDVCGNLKAHIENETKIMGAAGLDARELSARFTADCVSNCLFGVDAGALTTESSMIRKYAKKMLAVNWKTVMILVMSDTFPRLNDYLRIPFVPKDVEAFFADLMRQAVDHRRQVNEDKADVLQYLMTLQEKKKFNDVELVANAITFFLDGYETSSVAMSWILYEIARDPRVQEKLRNEILSGGDLTMDSIADLPYLDQVVHEAMRLHTPFPWTVKKCVEDCEMPLTKDGKKTFKIPAGTSVTIPLYDINRDPDSYENPLEFMPERFDEGKLKTFKEQGKYLVFGMGPRMCLGIRFALTQIKAALVEIIKNFEVSVNEKTQTPLVMKKGEFMNVVEGGILLDFKGID